MDTSRVEVRTPTVAAAKSAAQEVSDLPNVIGHHNSDRQCVVPVGRHT